VLLRVRGQELLSRRKQESPGRAATGTRGEGEKLRARITDSAELGGPESAASLDRLGTNRRDERIGFEGGDLMRAGLAHGRPAGVNKRQG